MGDRVVSEVFRDRMIVEGSVAKQLTVELSLLRMKRLVNKIL